MKKKVQSLLIASFGMIMLAALFAFPTSVFADTANTPVGQLTATQGTCFDLGAQVNVSVSGGFANTSYVISALHTTSGPVSFVTNSSGSGSALLINVRSDTGAPGGTTTITATTSNNQTGVVTLNLTCSGGKG